MGTSEFNDDGGDPELNGMGWCFFFISVVDLAGSCGAAARWREKCAFSQENQELTVSNVICL
jgi:hypothetical protein